MKRLIGVTMLALTLLAMVGCGRSHRSEQPTAPAEVQLERGEYRIDSNALNIMFKNDATEEQRSGLNVMFREHQALGHMIRELRGDSKEPLSTASLAYTMNEQRRGIEMGLNGLKEAAVETTFAGFDVNLGGEDLNKLDVRMSYKITDNCEPEAVKASFNPVGGNLTLIWRMEDSVFTYTATQSVDQEHIVRMIGDIERRAAKADSEDRLGTEGDVLQRGQLTLILKPAEATGTEESATEQTPATSKEDAQPVAGQGQSVKPVQATPDEGQSGSGESSVQPEAPVVPAPQGEATGRHSEYTR